MSQLATSDSQPGDWEELDCFLRRLEAERFQEYGWQEPYESRGSRTVLRGTGGEIPPVYPTKVQVSSDCFFKDIIIPYHNIAKILIAALKPQRQVQIL